MYSNGVVSSSNRQVESPPVNDRTPMPLSDPCPHHGVCALDSIPQMWRTEEENTCKVMTALGGSEMVVRLIDARKLHDKKAIEMALEWLSPEAGLTVVFLAMKPLATNFERKARRKRLLEMLMEKCSITFFDLDLITLTKEHIMEEEWIFTDVTEIPEIQPIATILSKSRERYMNYFEEIAAGGCRTARCTTRSVQSKSLAVILMGTVNFDLEAVAEMRRKAALEMERTFAASEVPEPNVLWVVAGVPVSNIQPAHLTIGQVSDGHPAIHRGVNLACTATDAVDIGMKICMGKIFAYKNPHRRKVNDRTPTVTTCATGLGARRVRPVRATGDHRGDEKANHWTDLSRRLIWLKRRFLQGVDYWTLRIARRWQIFSAHKIHIAQRARSKSVWESWRKVEEQAREREIQRGNERAQASRDARRHGVQPCRLPPAPGENNSEQDPSDHHAVVKQTMEAGAGQKKCSKGQNGKHRAAKRRRLKNIKKQKALATQALHTFDDYCALAPQRKAAEEDDEHRESLDDAVSRPRLKRKDRRQQTQSSVRGEPVVGNSDVEALARHLFVGICAGKLGPLRDDAAGRVAVRGG